MNFSEQTKLGFKMMLLSYQYIRQNKKVLIYTLLSTVLSTGILILFVGLIIELVHYSKSGTNQHLIFDFITTIFKASIILQFVNAYLETALIYNVSSDFENQNVGFFQSLYQAAKKIPTLVFWVLINWTIGLILSSVNSKNGISGFLYRATMGALALGWSILTFFVIPIIALENNSTFESIKKSGKVMENTFGQNVGGVFSLSLVHGLLLSGATLFFLMPSIFLLKSYLPETTHFNINNIITLFQSNPEILILSFTLFTLPLLIINCLTKTAKNIFKVASYHSTLDKPTGPFDNGFINSVLLTNK